MLYSICVRTLTLKFLTLSRSGERMRLLCTHLVLAHILLEGTLFSLNIRKIHIFFEVGNLDNLLQVLSHVEHCFFPPLSLVGTDEPPAAAPLALFVLDVIP